MALLLERLRAHLDRARLFPAPGSAVLAVSGGPDSVALLDLMLAVARERGLSLVVAHADHGIRADSRTVGQSVGELARRSGLPFELGELELGPGATETAARRARYAWLALVQRRHAARYLVTAHHADDQVETILLRVLKGSGPAGLAGMPARGRGGIVRPLLPFSRAELAVHVAERGLAFHDDPANRDPRHLRSWLRVTLLPQLVTRLGTNLRADVLRLGRAAAVERRAWDRALELVPELRLQRSAGGFDVARAPLSRYDTASPAGRSARAGGSCGRPAGAAVADGGTRAAQLAGELPGRRPRRNHSVGSRKLPERSRPPAARNSGGAVACYRVRRVSSRRAGVSSPASSSMRRPSRGGCGSWAARSRRPTLRASWSCSGCSRGASSF